jgi:hypothetical protein
MQALQSECVSSIGTGSLKNSVERLKEGSRHRKVNEALHLIEPGSLKTNRHGWKRVQAPQGEWTLEISIEPGSLKNSTAPLKESGNAEK